MKLQLFADEAGAAENETATPASADENVKETLPSDENAAGEIGPEGEESHPDDGNDEALPPEERSRLLKIAEGLARARLEKSVSADCEKQLGEVRAVYPSFSIARELANPAFSRLVSLGVPLKNAYEAANFDRLVAGAMRYAAKRTAERTAAAPQRIGENPVLDRASAVRKTDVGSLTEREIRRVIEAAGRGEKITFR